MVKSDLIVLSSIMRYLKEVKKVVNSLDLSAFYLQTKINP